MLFIHVCVLVKKELRNIIKRKNNLIFRRFCLYSILWYCFKINLRQRCKNAFTGKEYGSKKKARGKKKSKNGFLYEPRQANLVLIAASAQSRQNLRYSLIQAVSQEEPSDRKPGPCPLWMAGHAQLKFVMTECSKTQIRLTGLICSKWPVCLLLNLGSLL